MNTAQDLIAAGDPQGALDLLQRQVRERAGDVKLRVFLFQLLCVLGRWERASGQLQLCGEMDASTLPMVNTYRDALQCELVREAVFAGKTTPMVFGQPQAWVAHLVEALQADARGDAALAQRLRADAFDAAPATSGSLGGIAFDWIADADSRLGPVLESVINGRYSWVPFSALAKVAIEEPVDLRDLVWAPAHLDFVNGGEAVALIPARYAGSGAESDGALQLARKTEWQSIGADQYRGLGQRVLTTSASELGLLEVRDIVLQPSALADVIH
ncbi:type VI secretion system accessory protein TagJ [Piscinibacter sp. XHJ-5]|uniref:type VI secretion system accessory protein TagJ n=1 Tax=Piscinibacter sp. XHJ-5 TaxID=3037797 RepID=UPI00245324FC|nr:type VI secretion system accessory protein TagJ [Piscinibacter sp. XHJ-5]